MTEMKVKNLAKTLTMKLEKYEVQVGLLEDKKRKKPLFKRFKNYAGKRLLREGGVSKGASLVKVAEYLDKKYKWLRKPFLIERNKELVLVINDIIKHMNGKGDKQRILNGFQAVVRNPILRGEYGKNNSRWAKIKGFDDTLMMTGQFFKNIKARFKGNV